jgi:hypothetical protein
MEWELHPVIFQANTLIWDRPLIDLFATSLNYKLETHILPLLTVLTAPEMHLVAFSEKPLCLIDVLTATMRADGVSPDLDEASFP